MASWLLCHVRDVDVFLLQSVEARLASIISGKLDSLNRDVLYTDLFVARQTSRICGVFSAVTR